MQNCVYLQKCYSNCAYMHGYCSFAFNILLFFSLSFTSLSLFSLVLPLSPLSLFISSPSLSPHWSSKQASTDLRSKPCHWSLKHAQSRRSTEDRHQSKHTRWSVLGFPIWWVGFGVLIRHGKRGQNFLTRTQFFQSEAKKSWPVTRPMFFAGQLTQPKPKPFFKTFFLVKKIIKLRQY